jgi:hypothetical protein
MKTIDKAEEKRLIRAIESAISSTNQGVSPNDAISKVAKEEQFSPQFIHRMVESFNKSKAVHRLKEASEEERHKSFTLADADVVMSKVFNEPMLKAASAVAVADDFIPTFTFGIDKMMAGSMQKSAKEEKPARELRPEEVKHEARVRANLVYKQAHIVKAVQDKLHREVVSEKYALDQAIERACDLILPMSNAEFRKVAQNVHNGYPQTGNTLVKVFSQKTRKPMGDIQKTANAVVFPTREPYITIGKIYEHAEKLAAAENECKMFEKESLNFLSSSAANALGNLATPGERSLGEALQGVVKKKTLDSDEILDPEFYNRLRELDARRSLSKLVLHDPDLRNYKYSDIVKAYNSSVSSVPEAANNPTVLKTLVMKNLESSGIKDVVELSQEQTLSQSMLKAEKDREKLRQDRMAEDEAEPEQPAAQNIYTTADEMRNRLKNNQNIEERARSLTEGISRTADHRSADIKRLKEKKELAQLKKGITAEEEDKWRAEAMNILRKGNPKNPMDMSVLGRFSTGGSHSPSVSPASTVEEMARDLRDIHTLPTSEWTDTLRTRGRHQYGVIK